MPRRAVAEFYENICRAMGYSNLVFMTVKRAVDHPLKPENYRSLEPIWNYFGYFILEGVTITLSWSQVDAPEEVVNELSVWCKAVK